MDRTMRSVMPEHRLKFHNRCFAKPGHFGYGYEEQHVFALVQAAGNPVF